MSGVGEALRTARESAGISVEQAERDTRIVRRYLLALEADDFSVFPAEVYARGFLRSYASYLKLNPTDLMAMMPREDDSEVVVRSARRRGISGSRVPHRRDDVVTSEPEPEQPDAEREPRPRRSRSSVHPGAVVALAVAGVALVGAVVGRVAGLDAPGLGMVSPRPDPATSLAGGAAGGGPAVRGAMPEVRGMDERTALEQLTGLGVTPFVIEIPSRDAPAGQVVRQSPEAGTRIGTGPVTIVISRGG